MAAPDFTYVVILDENGNPITGANPLDTAGGASGGTSMQDDGAFTPATSSFTPAGGIVTADEVDSGDGGAFAMLANRQQKITLYDSSGVEVSVGGGTQYDEDTASSAADKITMAGVVRKDTAATLVDTDGDRTQLQVDASGRLHVNVGNTVTVGSHAVTNAGTFAVQVDGAALTALQLIDNLVLAEDAAHQTGDPGIQLLAVRQDTQADFAADGDYVPLSVDADGQLRVAASVQASAADYSYADDADWTDDTSKHALVGGLYQSSPQTVTDGDVAPFNMTVNGALHVAQQGNITVNAHAVTNAGTFAVQVDGSALTALQLIDNLVLAEDAAHQTADPGVQMLAVRDDTLNARSGAENDYEPLHTDANGALWVRHTSDTIAVTQSGTWDEVGINDSGNSITVDNGGTFAVQVDGAALTALQLIDDPVATLGTTTYTETTTKGMIVGAVRRDADTTLVDTTNEVGPLQMNAAGQLKVEIFDGGDSHTVDNGGTFAVQVDGSALTALQLIDDIVYTDDTSTHATGTSKGALIMAAATPTDGAVNANDIGAVAMTVNREMHVSLTTAIPAGTNGIGKLTANSGVDIGDVDVTSISAGSNLIGDVGIQPRTTNGLTTFMASGSDGSSILMATAQAIKASAGKLYGYYAYNPEAAVTFVHFYNTAAASVTVGTTNPLFTLAIPAGAAANLMSDIGITFSNAGWSCAATTTAGGNTAPATGVSLVAWYA